GRRRGAAPFAPPAARIGKRNHAPPAAVRRGAGLLSSNGPRLGPASDPRDVRRLEALLGLPDLELDLLALGERLEAFHVDRGEVHEHVLAVGLFNEAIALGIIEPLDLTSGH